MEHTIPPISFLKFPIDPSYFAEKAFSPLTFIEGLARLLARSERIALIITSLAELAIQARLIFPGDELCWDLLAIDEAQAGALTHTKCSAKPVTAIE
jgi:hypothetical protein